MVENGNRQIDKEAIEQTTIEIQRKIKGKHISLIYTLTVILKCKIENVKVRYVQNTNRSILYIFFQVLYKTLLSRFRQKKRTAFT